MTGPGEGWYSDPADPGQERWWSGLEWTHTVRPLAAPAAPVYAPPALLDVPGGGINPFAAIDPQEANAYATSGASVGVPAASNFSGYGHYDGGAPAAPAPAWNTSAPQQIMGPPPSNGAATAGLVLSLVGLYGLGIIFSIRGLLHANKLVRWGEHPAGRKRAGWGLAVGIAGPLAIAVLVSILVPVLLAQQDRMSADGVIRGPLGIPAVYDREVAEQGIYEGFAQAGENVSEVTCPDEAEMVVGGGYECSMFYLSMTHRVGVVFTDTDGNFYMTFDGLILE